MQTPTYGSPPALTKDPVLRFVLALCCFACGWDERYQMPRPPPRTPLPGREPGQKGEAGKQAGTKDTRAGRKDHRGR